MEEGVAISVIIPALNEAGTLAYTIDCIKANMPDRYPYEIIVGDHGSTDDTRQVALNASGVRVVDCQNYSSIAEVRNTCAWQSESTYLLFLDADISLTASWATPLDKAIHLADSGSIVGSRPLAAGGGAIERSWFNYLNLNYLGGAHMFMRRTTFSRLGGFDASKATGEDVDFCERAEADDIPVCIMPEMEVYHRRYPSTMRDFFYREVWHGIGDWYGFRPASMVAAISALFVATLAAGFFFPVVWATSIGIAAAVTNYKFPRWVTWDTYLVRLALTILYMVARFYSIFFQRKRKRTFSW